jgi:hypothetical protein
LTSNNQAANANWQMAATKLPFTGLNSVTRSTKKTTLAGGF